MNKVTDCLLLQKCNPYLAIKEFDLAVLLLFHLSDELDAAKLNPEDSTLFLMKTSMTNSWEAWMLVASS